MEKSPLQGHRRDVRKVTLVIIGGDRGLCGSFNAQVIKRATIRFQELRAAGLDVNCVVIGNRVASWFARRPEKYPMLASYECGYAPAPLSRTCLRTGGCVCSCPPPPPPMLGHQPPAVTGHTVSAASRRQLRAGGRRH